MIFEKEPVLATFYHQLSENDKVIYQTLAQHLESLGCKAKRAKTQDLNIVFIDNKSKKHLAKFSLDKNGAHFKMKFYASCEYSHFFQEAIRLTIEEFNYKYTGCYSCGKCKAELQGYYYTYSDGRSYFRCCSELIDLPGFSKEHLAEAMALLTTQHNQLMEDTH